MTGRHGAGAARGARGARPVLLLLGVAAAGGIAPYVVPSLAPSVQLVDGQAEVPLHGEVTVHARVLELPGGMSGVACPHGFHVHALVLGGGASYTSWGCRSHPSLDDAVRRCRSDAKRLVSHCLVRAGVVDSAGECDAPDLLRVLSAHCRWSTGPSGALVPIPEAASPPASPLATPTSPEAPSASGPPGGEAPKAGGAADAPVEQAVPTPALVEGRTMDVAEAAAAPDAPDADGAPGDSAAPDAPAERRAGVEPADASAATAEEGGGGTAAAQGAAAAEAAAEGVAADEATGAEGATADRAVQTPDASDDASPADEAALAEGAEPAPPSAPVDEGDEILPLEQWKEEQLMRMVASGMAGGGQPAVVAAAPPGTATPQPASESAAESLPFVRPTTPLKDRFNYLSANAGAKLLAAAPEMTGAANVLNEDRDRYAMTERGVKKKWLTVSLIEDILLDTVTLANFEYYSSSARRFQLLGSQTYPCRQWALLGEFEANDTRSEQHFFLPNPLWVRYVKLRFLSQYGAEHYWSLSLLRAHGQTHVDKFNSDNARLQETKMAMASEVQQQIEKEAAEMEQPAAEPADAAEAEGAGDDGPTEAARAAEPAPEERAAAEQPAGADASSPTSPPPPPPPPSPKRSPPELAPADEASPTPAEEPRPLVAVPEKAPATEAAPDAAQDSAPATAQDAAPDATPEAAPAVAPEVAKEEAAAAADPAPSADDPRREQAPPMTPAAEAAGAEAEAEAAATTTEAANASEGVREAAGADDARPEQVSQAAAVGAAPPDAATPTGREANDSHAAAPAAPAVNTTVSTPPEATLTSADAAAGAPSQEGAVTGSASAPVDAAGAVKEDASARPECAETGGEPVANGPAGSRAKASVGAASRNGDGVMSPPQSPPDNASDAADASGGADAPSEPHTATPSAEPDSTERNATNPEAAALAAADPNATETVAAEANASNATGEGVVTRTARVIRDFIVSARPPSTRVEPPSPCIAPPPRPPPAAPTQRPPPPAAGTRRAAPTEASVSFSAPPPSPPAISPTPRSTPPPPPSAPRSAPPPLLAPPAGPPPAASAPQPNASAVQAAPDDAAAAAVPSAEELAAQMAAMQAAMPPGTGALGRSVEQLATIPRNDPNNIFNALTMRMGQLELNQSLINNWLTLWQNKINTKIKSLNATHEEALVRLRGMQSNVSAVQADLLDVASKQGLFTEERLAFMESSGWNVSAASFEKQLRRVEGQYQESERRLRSELHSLQARHRIELVVCMLLCLGMSWFASVYCQANGRHSRRPHSRGSRWTSDGEHLRERLSDPLE